MIELEGATKRYGEHTAVDALHLRIARGELVALIGPSGSGKSTTLRLINRLIECDAGAIRIGGEDVRSVAPEVLRRRMGYAIQSVGLFPHWTVEKNIATVPRLLRWPEARIRARVQELMVMLDLDPQIYAQRHPHELSGGQQQRVGVARALAADPEILLMDEPFGALDPLNRATLQQELKRIHRASGKTIVLVTHDLDEALALADRLVLMHGGRLAQEGHPMDLLTRPASPFVAEFLGREAAGLQRLALGTVRQHLRRDATAAGLPLRLDASLKDALNAFLAQGRDTLPVIDAQAKVVGAIAFADLLLPPP